MRDVIFLAIVVVFFILAALYVRACAAIVGADELLVADEPGGEPHHTDTHTDTDEEFEAMAS